MTDWKQKEEHRAYMVLSKELRSEDKAEIERLRAALERITSYDVLDPTGYQGVDAYAMADIAREALKDD